MGKINAVVSVIGSIAIMLCFASCGSSSPLPSTQTGFDIPWPPPQNGLKFASNDELVIGGQDVSSRGGDTYNIGFPFSLQMAGGGELPWAIYSVRGFTPEVAFSQLTFESEIRPSGPGDGSELFLGFANYTSGTWEWFNPGDGTYIHPVADDTDYISPEGAIHFAVVFVGPNLAFTNVLSLAIQRTGDTDISPPFGLTAQPSLNDITLTWLEAAKADGYHIYRDEHKDFPAPVKLTDGAPVTELTFVDDTTVRGVMYYYKASSTQDLLESPLSDFVDIFAPELTKLAPTNLGSYSLGPDDLNVTWQTGSTFPDYWWVYYSEEPDFNLDSLSAIEVVGYKEEVALDLKDMGDTIYWRVCAFQSGKHGFMTNDLEAVTSTIWTWDSPEVLGTGTEPMSLVYVDGDYSAAYINGTEVDFSRRTAGAWNTETALSTDTFGGSVAMSYGGGEYIIATQDIGAHDLFVATGGPGAWDEVRVHGDDDDSEEHPLSGNNIQAASSATEHIVIHIEAGGDVLLHSKPNGGDPWSAPTSLWTASMMADFMSLAELDSNFYLLSLDKVVGELMLSDQDGGWVQANMLAPELIGVGEDNSLTRFEDEWWTPGFNSTPGERQLHMLNGTTAPWTETLVHDTGHVGENASLAALDTKLFCTYFRRDNEGWAFALYDGSSWETGWLILPGTDITRAVAGGLGDTPYVLVNDTVSGQVIGYTGTPPA